jgi:small conductance mechanosensitive channel
MSIEPVWDYFTTYGEDFALKVAGALLAWVVGRWLIRWLRRLARAAIQRGQRFDPTLAGYLGSAFSIALNVLLVLAILEIFGVRSTSFAALLAGAGLAIGTAWGGLLTHFAAGVFLQVLRPYKVGDQVLIGGVNGKVVELGLYGTTVVTADNVVALVGNNKILSDTIQNFSALPARRVEATCKIGHDIDVRRVMGQLSAAVSRIPNVASDPPPEIEIVQFTAEGPLLAVRPYTHSSHHSQVLADTHQAIFDTLGRCG